MRLPLIILRVEVGKFPNLMTGRVTRLPSGYIEALRHGNENGQWPREGRGGFTSLEEALRWLIPEECMPVDPDILRDAMDGRR